MDTASAMETREAVRQITGGCFCCRSGELMAALAELEKSAQPDVYIAEPVGSCTDLVATVLLPLEQVYKSGLRRAPMSVVLDARRLLWASRELASFQAFERMFTASATTAEAARL